jgi:hypothetical protein
MVTLKERSRTATHAPTPDGGPEEERNPGMPLELDWVREVRVNRSAVERRAATIGTRGGPSRRTGRPPGCCAPSPAST